MSHMQATIKKKRVVNILPATVANARGNQLINAVNMLISDGSLMSASQLINAVNMLISDGKLMSAIIS